MKDGRALVRCSQNQWSPIYDISAILTSIQSLLTDPNPNSPANNEAAKLWPLGAMVSRGFWATWEVGEPAGVQPQGDGDRGGELGGRRCHGGGATATA